MSTPTQTPLTDAFAATFTTWTIGDLNKMENFARDLEQVLGQVVSEVEKIRGAYRHITRVNIYCGEALAAYEQLKQKYKV